MNVFHRVSSPVFLAAASMVLLLPSAAAGASPPASQPVDVCVYGATPAGIVAAVTAKQEGRSVLLVEPSRWVGGMLGAGIKPMQDCAEPRAVGGLTSTKVFKLGNTPPAIRAGFAAWLKAEQVPVLFEHRIARVEKDGPRIAESNSNMLHPTSWAFLRLPIGGPARRSKPACSSMPVTKAT